MSHDYGGIYVGSTTTTRQFTTSLNEREHSETLVNTHSPELILQPKNIHNSVINKCKTSGDENKIPIVHGAALCTNFSFIESSVYAAPESNADASFNDEIFILPNQVLDEDEIITTCAQVHSDSFPSTETLVAKHKSNSSVATNNPDNTQMEFRALEYKIPHTEVTEINKIEAVSESSVVDNALDSYTDDKQRNYFQKDTASSAVTFDCLSSNELYRDSKEHKSIMKASIANIVFLFLLIVFLLIKEMLGPVRSNNIRLYIGIYVFLKLYRTFATLIMAIYCFEVVNRLFYQTADNIKDCIQNFCDVVCNVFQRHG